MSTEQKLGLSGDWITEVGKGYAASFQIEEKLHEEQTPYQKIEVFRSVKFGNIMMLDGFMMVTDLDNFLYHEMMSHPVLFCHPDPRNVVIVGGGDCGTLQQVLQHRSVQTVQQIEIDERVTRLSEQYFPDLCKDNHDPRAQFDFIDAIDWMANAQANSVDIIIVDSTDPIGPGEGLFNVSFYQNCRRVLREPGILIHQSESPLYDLPLLTSIHQAMATAGFVNRHSLYFPQPVYPSGWWSGTMAAKGEINLMQFREHDAAAKSFATRYYSADIHRACLATPPMLAHLAK